MGFHPVWSDIATCISDSECIFIKKLSRNDTSWADSSNNGHQNGFFIPRAVAESDFFPALKNSNPEKPHILDVEYMTFWPASGEVKISTIKHFSKRNPSDKEKAKPRYEWQHTGMPKEQFRLLSPASLLVVGKFKQAMADTRYWFIVVDSVSEEAEIIETAFELGADFHYGLFDPASLAAPASETDQLIIELSQAMKDGTLEQFIKKQTIPSPEALAVKAQTKWLDEKGYVDLNPFSISQPGDAVMRISRDIEYSIYKQAELRFRAAQVARILLHGGGDPVANLVRAFSQLDSIFLSAAQTRKSRAGLSFEHHVGRLFKDGRIRYAAQVVFGGRRPDFVLPDIKELNVKGDAVIVSLKTTLRERWKQLALEKPLGAIFLATVDDRVSGEAIDEMSRHSISLVVPESLKKAKESAYDGYDNVITFRQFFDNEVRLKRPSLIIPL
ncbi:type II restriction endonuclease [Pseudomonas sp. CCI3.2]|uniref:type II restriction endonuclease n=1 Tax=unclassified Pseudomonas TaxID=196821 RepID=UPI002AC9E821|nr:MULTISPECIES: type II restriction endonuclease [unclassified Pseudomonas]MEB0075838.1 type II restriction endonuclease [Pseudomonas sp. MH10out]MEB0102764.1 type II restriction endonuclease [Pseudomonas sp. CCI3.2]MEB0131592.1 type II restriction endonuclease [Pseudomonas sp. CCI2.4]MEB0156485.1 type II restriction endonuclease [Pseudomonas sp. AH2 (2023)]MEB0170104.1 type II restriction endonuclease [Pseudomonas sp. CCC4.4]